MAPTIEENLRIWDGRDWSRGGEEWSGPWGCSDRQWREQLLPLVERFLDCGTILEIGPGAGRWTQFLKDRCRRLLAVDLSPKCVDICRRRFADSPHVHLMVNDGMTFSAVKSRCVDFIFSFDSLVHADPPVLRSYIKEAARILKPNGAGFIHHSNLGACPDDGMPSEQDQHWRSRTMTAELFRSFCEEAGIRCEHQKLVDWSGTGHNIDCFSIFRQPSRSIWSRFFGK